MSKLKRKFLGYFLATLIVPVAVISITLLTSIGAVHRNDLQLVAENLVSQKAAELSRSLDGFFEQFRLVLIREDDQPPDRSSQRFIAGDLLARNPNLLEVSFICVVSRCELGHETAHLGRNGTPALLDRSDDPAFTTARAGHQYVSPVTFRAGRAVLTVANPVQTKRGLTVAVLAVTFDLSSLQTLVRQATLGRTGYLYLTDASGRVLAHPRSALVGAPAPAATEAVLRATRRYDRLGWWLVAEWPLREVDSFIERTLTRLIVFVIAAVAVVVVIASWLGTGLLRPIQTLIAGARAVGAGQLDQQVEIKTGDELEDLGTQFNTMVRELREIESLSRALTKERELSTIKDKFLTTISHQLNTPLSVIGWALEELPEAFKRPETRQTVVDGLQAGHQHLGRIIADTLDLTELGVGYRPVRPELTDVAVIIREALAALAQPIILKKLTVTVAPPSAQLRTSDGPFELTGDRPRLVKLFRALLENAVTYNRTNGRIKVTLDRTNEGVTVTITDTGIGVPAADQPLLLREIIRGRNAIEGENVGTGMGLLIARIIAEGHGGHLSLSSTEGTGSFFTVWLPFRYTGTTA